MASREPTGRRHLGSCDSRAIAEARAASIMAELDRLPPAVTDDGATLARTTREFLASPHWPAAVALGWTLEQLFGVDPAAATTRIECQGLVIRLAWRPCASLDALNESGARLRTANCCRIYFNRRYPDLDQAVVWWRCPALIGEPE